MFGQRSLIAWGLVLVSLTGSCSQDSKSTQCSNFTKAISQMKGILNASESSATQKNGTVTTIEEFQKLARDSAATMNQRVEQIDKAVKVIQALEVTDEQLQILKNEYLEVIEKAGSTTRSLADIYTAQSKVTKETIKDPIATKLTTDLAAAAKTYSAETTQESKLIGRVNTYCNAK
jgi:hypothetical protein